MLGSAIEWILACRLSADQPAEDVPRLTRSSYLRGTALKRNLNVLFQHRVIWQAVLGLTLFLSISQVMIAVFPAYAKTSLSIHNAFIVQSVIAMAIVGIMMGAGIAAKQSHNHINLSLIPMGAVVVAVCLWLLPQMTSSWFLGGLFLLIGMGGSFMMVPLNALIQFHAKASDLGTMLAGNNFIQNIGMLVFLGITVGFSLLEYDVSWLLWGLFGLAVLVAVTAILRLPHAVIRPLIGRLTGYRRGFRVMGFEHVPRAGKGTLLLGNRHHWFDWVVVQMVFPRSLFVVVL